MRMPLYRHAQASFWQAAAVRRISARPNGSNAEYPADIELPARLTVTDLKRSPALLTQVAALGRMLPHDVMTGQVPKIAGQVRCDWAVKYDEIPHCRTDSTLVSHRQGT